MVKKGRSYFYVEEKFTKTYKYKYNGKEYQDELSLNLYDYGARNYDPALGRWMNIDPLAERNFSTSAYAYVINSPLIYTDPDGMDKYIINDEGKTILALKQKGDDILYAIDKNGDLKDTNKDNKKDEKDGVTVKTKGLIGQLTSFRKGSEENGEKYISSIGEQSEQHESDYYSLFKYVSDNTPVEFSLTFFSDRGKDFIQLATFGDTAEAPGHASLGISLLNLKKEYHSHPGINSSVASERYSMGEFAKNQIYPRSDFGYAINNKRTYPNYVYFPNSKRLYNVNMYNIKFITKVNNPKNLKQ